MGTQDRIETLKQRKARIEKELAAIEAREKARERKEETRLKVLVGAGILADSKIHPEIVDLVQEILGRAITAERDRAFLQRKGWLTGTALDEEATGEKGSGPGQ